MPGLWVRDTLCVAMAGLGGLSWVLPRQPRPAGLVQGGERVGAVWVVSRVPGLTARPRGQLGQVGPGREDCPGRWPVWGVGGGKGVSLPGEHLPAQALGTLGQCPGGRGPSCPAACVDRAWRGMEAWSQGGLCGDPM